MKIITVKDCRSCPWIHSNRHHQALCLMAGHTLNMADMLRVSADVVPFPEWCPLPNSADSGAGEHISQQRHAASPKGKPCSCENTTADGVTIKCLDCGHVIYP